MAEITHFFLGQPLRALAGRRGERPSFLVEATDVAGVAAWPTAARRGTPASNLHDTWSKASSYTLFNAACLLEGVPPPMGYFLLTPEQQRRVEPMIQMLRSDIAQRRLLPDLDRFAAAFALESTLIPRDQLREFARRTRTVAPFLGVGDLDPVPATDPDQPYEAALGQRVEEIVRNPFDPTISSTSLPEACAWHGFGTEVPADTILRWVEARSVRHLDRLTLSFDAIADAAKAERISVWGRRRIFGQSSAALAELLPPGLLGSGRYVPFWRDGSLLPTRDRSVEGYGGTFADPEFIDVTIRTKELWAAFGSDVSPTIPSDNSAIPEAASKTLAPIEPAGRVVSVLMEALETLPVPAVRSRSPKQLLEYLAGWLRDNKVTGASVSSMRRAKGAYLSRVDQTSS